MKKSYRVIRRIIVAIIGVPIVVLGIILIPLPGPGILVTILGLFVLSLEFESVKKPLDKYLAKLKKIYFDAKDRQQKIIDKNRDGQ